MVLNEGQLSTASPVSVLARPSFTNQTLEGREPAAGGGTDFPFLKDPVASAQQVGGEPLPAQP